MLGPLEGAGLATVSTQTLALLMSVAALAGFIDAIAGGGGLLTVPALLAAGFPPHLALGINKGQSVFGSAVATFRYARHRLISWSNARVNAPAAFVSSLAGAGLVSLMSPATLRPLVLVLLVLAGVLVVWKRPTKSSSDPAAGRLTRRWKMLALAVLIAAYDGFFGPGTGTFLVVGFTVWLGMDLSNATGEAKVINVASNAAAVLLFAYRGNVLWGVALPMASAQLVGSWVGAGLAVTRGAEFIRRAVVAVVIALVLRLTYDGMVSAR